MSALRGFHHRVARQITGKQPRKQGDTWVYPPTADALEEAGMHTMEEYIARRQRRLVDYVATRPIYEVADGTIRLSGTRSRQLWWELLAPGD